MREYKEIEIPEELLNELVSSGVVDEKDAPELVEIVEVELSEEQQEAELPKSFNPYDDDFVQIHDVPEIDDLLEEEIKPPVVREERRSQVAISEDTYQDPFKNKEHELYRSALDVYEDALVAGNEKVRLAAAKDILLLHGKNKELEIKKDTNNDKGNNYTQINISVEAVQKALSDALYGLQGGYKIMENETGEEHGEANEQRANVHIPVEGAFEEGRRNQRGKIS